MAVCAFLFPGQGSQFVGMGKALAETFSAAKDVFEIIDDTLKQPLSRLMMEGPEEELTLTKNTQPALMAHSMAVIRVLEKEANIQISEVVSMAAGHSLGEYSALSSAGVFDIATTAHLLKIRGESMQQAVGAGEGGMAALLGTNLEQTQEICKQASQTDSMVTLANDNGAGQIVISGHQAAIDRALTVAEEKGVRRAVKLTVSAPFHSPLMAPAAEKMQAALAGVELHKMKVPVIANVTAQPYKSEEKVKELLVKQVTAPVRWAETLQFMLNEEVEYFFEIGSGKVLSNLLKRVARDRQVYSLGEPKDIEAFVKLISNLKIEKRVLTYV